MTTRRNFLLGAAALAATGPAAFAQRHIPLGLQLYTMRAVLAKDYAGTMKLVKAAGVREVQANLPVPLALENIATLVEAPGAELDEPAFLTELLERTDAMLLLDVANVHANATNHGFEARGFLDRVPLERIAYVHMAGGVEHHGVYHDTHVHPIQQPVLDLLSELVRRTEVPGVLWEHDDCFGPDEAMAGELARIAGAVAVGTAKRGIRRVG